MWWNVAGQLDSSIGQYDALSLLNLHQECQTRLFEIVVGGVWHWATFDNSASKYSPWSSGGMLG